MELTEYEKELLKLTGVNDLGNTEKLVDFLRYEFSSVRYVKEEDYDKPIVEFLGYKQGSYCLKDYKDKNIIAFVKLFNEYSSEDDDIMKNMSFVAINRQGWLLSSAIGEDDDIKNYVINHLLSTNSNLYGFNLSKFIEDNDGFEGVLTKIKVVNSLPTEGEEDTLYLTSGNIESEGGVVEVPVPTSVDEGKVLQVNASGKYALGSSGTKLYRHEIYINSGDDILDITNQRENAYTSLAQIDDEYIGGICYLSSGSLGYGIVTSMILDGTDLYVWYYDNDGSDDTTPPTLRCAKGTSVLSDTVTPL